MRTAWWTRSERVNSSDGSQKQTRITQQQGFKKKLIYSKNNISLGERVELEIILV
jgi:hypothetical protein